MLTNLIKSNIVSAVVIGLESVDPPLDESFLSMSLPGCINITQNMPCKTASDVVAA